MKNLLICLISVALVACSNNSRIKTTRNAITDNSNVSESRKHQQKIKYQPIVSIEGNRRVDNLRVEPIDKLSAAELANIIQVFDHYNIDHSVIDGELFYYEVIERELLWNFTLKSRDPKWLAEHKY